MRVKNPAHSFCRGKAALRSSPTKVGAFNHLSRNIRDEANSLEIRKGCERDAHSPICYKMIRSGLCSAFSVSQNQATEAE